MLFAIAGDLNDGTKEVFVHLLATVEVDRVADSIHGLRAGYKGFQSALSLFFYRLGDGHFELSVVFVVELSGDENCSARLLTCRIRKEGT